MTRLGIDEATMFLHFPNNNFMVLISSIRFYGSWMAKNLPQSSCIGFCISASLLGFLTCAFSGSLPAL